MNKQPVLITGGSGYIGTITALCCSAQGFKPVLFDIAPPPAIISTDIIPHITGDIRSSTDIAKAFQTYNPLAVIHLAALTSIQDSTERPQQFFDTNIQGGQLLLAAMMKYSCKHIVFASSAAVYGEPQKKLVETDTLTPINFYGETKRLFESELSATASKDGIKFSILRYFNVAGVSQMGQSEKLSPDSTKLIPSILQVYLKKRKELIIFGDTFPTADGTAIRDYVHVDDVATANVLTLKSMLNTGKNTIYNVGSGVGTSVQDVITQFEDIAHCKIPTLRKKNRPHESSSVVSDISHITKELQWQPVHSSIRSILKSYLGQVNI